MANDIKKRKFKPTRLPVMIDVWKCSELKELIHEKIQASVKDVEIAKRLEHALADEIAYGTGGSGGIAVT